MRLEYENTGRWWSVYSECTVDRSIECLFKRFCAVCERPKKVKCVDFAGLYGIGDVSMLWAVVDDLVVEFEI